MEAGGRGGEGEEDIREIQGLDILLGPSCIRSLGSLVMGLTLSLTQSLGVLSVFVDTDMQRKSHVATRPSSPNALPSLQEQNYDI